MDTVNNYILQYVHLKMDTRVWFDKIIMLLK